MEIIDPRYNQFNERCQILYFLSQELTHPKYSELSSTEHGYQGSSKEPVPTIDDIIEKVTTFPNERTLALKLSFDDTLRATLEAIDSIAQLLTEEDILEKAREAFFRPGNPDTTDTIIELQSGIIDLYLIAIVLTDQANNTLSERIKIAEEAVRDKILKPILNDGLGSIIDIKYFDRVIKEFTQHTLRGVPIKKRKPISGSKLEELHRMFFLGRHCEDSE